MTTDLGHDAEIGEAFAAYDRLVRWEGHSPRLDATDPIHERAAARGHIVALIANLAAAQAGGGLRAALDEAQRALRDAETKPWMVALRDLDRCEHGRHAPDVCDGCGGQSHGNPLADVNVGYDIDGKPWTAARLRALVATPQGANE